MVAPKVVVPHYPHKGVGDHQRLLEYILKDCIHEKDMAPFVAELTEEELASVLFKSGMASALEIAAPPELPTKTITQASVPGSSVVVEEVSSPPELMFGEQDEEPVAEEVSEPEPAPLPPQAPLRVASKPVMPVEPPKKPILSPPAPAASQAPKPGRTSFDDDLDALFGSK